MKRTIYFSLNILGWIGVAALFGYSATTLREYHLAGDFGSELGFLYLLLIHLWIFIGANDKTFIYRNGQGFLSWYHYLMMGAYLVNFYLSSVSILIILIGFGFALIDGYQEAKVFRLPVGNWVLHSKRPLRLEKVLEVLSEGPMLLDVIQENNKTIVIGRSCLIFEIKVELFSNRTKINIGYQSTSLVFLLGWKLAPIPFGQYYGKKFLKALEMEPTDDVVRVV